MTEGQEVEVLVKIVARPRSRGAKASSGPLGPWADWTEEDAVMDEIHQGRKQDRRPQGTRMSYLLDTDICSAHLKRPAGLMHRFVQHCGGPVHPDHRTGRTLHLGVPRRQSRPAVLQRIDDLLQDVHVLDFDSDCAKEFGKVRGGHAPARNLGPSRRT